MLSFIDDGVISFVSLFANVELVVVVELGGEESFDNIFGGTSFDGLSFVICGFNEADEVDALFRN